MNTLSPWHLLILLVIPAVLLGFPVAKILQRLGISPWWTILMFFPLLNLIGLWMLSFVRWPRLEQQSAQLGKAFD
jgi:hypothetical protein